MAKGFKTLTDSKKRNCISPLGCTVFIITRRIARERLREKRERRQCERWGQNLLDDDGRDDPVLGVQGNREQAGN